MATIGVALAEGAARLTAAGIESARLDARLLLAAATGRTVEQIVARPEQMLSVHESAAFDGLIGRRAHREPVSQLLGHREFWSLDFVTTRDVLTPRPDTETVVEYALRDFPEHAAWSVLDLGMGSGAILLAILAERPAARGLGVDISEDALAVARPAAGALGLAGRVALLRGDWTTGLGEATFDLVVANPPYIASAVIETLEPEVRDHEPRAALDGGPDGLDLIRRLVAAAPALLAPGGALALEVGAGQAPAVAAICLAAGLADIQQRRDLGSVDRVVSARKP